MLKIKDNIDLKELEKYGFKPIYDENTGELIEYNQTGLYYEIRGTNIKICKIKKKHILSFQKENYTLHHSKIFAHKNIIWGLIYYTDEDLTTNGWMYKHNKNSGGRSYYLFDTLYDLIKDGLVEKVEG